MAAASSPASAHQYLEGLPKNTPPEVEASQDGNFLILRRALKMPNGEIRDICINVKETSAQTGRLVTIPPSELLQAGTRNAEGIQRFVSRIFRTLEANRLMKPDSDTLWYQKGAKDDVCQVNGKSVGDVKYLNGDFDSELYRKHPDRTPSVLDGTRTIFRNLIAGRQKSAPQLSPSSSTNQQPPLLNTGSSSTSSSSSPSQPVAQPQTLQPPQTNSGLNASSTLLNPPSSGSPSQPVAQPQALQPPQTNSSLSASSTLLNPPSSGSPSLPAAQPQALQLPQTSSSLNASSTLLNPPSSGSPSLPEAQPQTLQPSQTNSGLNASSLFSSGYKTPSYKSPQIPFSLMNPEFQLELFTIPTGTQPVQPHSHKIHEPVQDKMTKKLTRQTSFSDFLDREIKKKEESFLKHLKDEKVTREIRDAFDELLRDFEEPISENAKEMKKYLIELRAHMKANLGNLGDEARALIYALPCARGENLKDRRGQPQEKINKLVKSLGSVNN